MRIYDMTNLMFEAQKKKTKICEKNKNKSTV